MMNEMLLFYTMTTGLMKRDPVAATKILLMIGTITFVSTNRLMKETR